MAMLGEIVRSDLGSGLQSQTYNLCRMLKPDRLLLVNSEPFNQREQHDYLYEGFNVQKTSGWPTNLDCARFIRGLSHIITAETAYNPKLYELARLHKVKIYTQLNWEFLDHIHNRSLPSPHMWLMPSYWKLEEMQSMFPNTIYLPPPIFMSDFKKARDINLQRNGPKRFLHIVGKIASHDRNGTLDLINAMKFSKGDFELIIRSQYDLPEYKELTNDHRIIFDIRNIPEQNDMYQNFDLMILPRRYGGLCLPMNEALACGLPVIMSNISPNNRVLPEKWLVDAEVSMTFMARTNIDVYLTDVTKLAMKLDKFAMMGHDELQLEKVQAVGLAIENYSSDVLKDKYKEIMEL